MEKVNRPKIVTDIPGPKTKAFIERDSKVMTQALSRSLPLVGVEAEDVWVKDLDGNIFMDLVAGVAVCNVGHRNPNVVQAIKEQADKLLHVNSLDYYIVPQVELAEKLVKYIPGNFDKHVFFTNSGTETVECALKVSKWNRKRYYFIGFINAFHGRTMGSLQFTTTSAAARRYYQPMMPGVVHVPYAYCYRCTFKQTYPDCGLYCIDYIEDPILTKVAPPEDVNGLLVEPAQGAGGYIWPPDDWLPRLQKMCNDLGITFIVDEIQSGLARTGKMFAMEHFNVVPDVTCVSKALAHGLPLGACIAKSEVMNWTEGAHENTLGANPIVIAAANAVVDTLVEGKFTEKAATVGAYLKKRLLELQQKYDLIGDVRGRGLMIGVEFVKDRRTKEYASKEKSHIVDYAFKNGIMLLGAGPTSIRLCPPLTLINDHVDIFIEVFEKAIKSI
jgi:4-aminobutyrate aminotransferase